MKIDKLQKLYKAATQGDWLGDEHREAIKQMHRSWPDIYRILRAARAVVGGKKLGSCIDMTKAWKLLEAFRALEDS